MSAKSKIRTAASVTSAVSVSAILFSSPALRAVLYSLFSPSNHPLRFLALLATLVLNFKSLPFIWHLRLFRSMLPLFFSRHNLPPDALFRPLVTYGCYTSLAETDYNMHKSNSTYFADLDIGRTMLVSRLLRRGYQTRKEKDIEWQRKHDQEVAEEAAQRKASSSAAAGLNGTARSWNDPKTTKLQDQPVLVALGGVSCNFHRELKPYQPFEIWTRVLSWDRKWVYLVSHIVRAGTVKPAGWALDTTRRPTQANGTALRSTKEVEQSEEFRKAVFASSISKYVVKRGRRTIHPEEVLDRSDLLPERPQQGEEQTAEEGAWTWANVEAERDRGLKYAEAFGLLDGLANEWPLAAADMEGLNENDNEKLGERRIETMGGLWDLGGWLLGR